MKADNKIVFMDGQYPAIMFPVGRPDEGGSCEFMTGHCRKYCPARSTNPHEQRAFDFFQKNLAFVIADKIIVELSELSMLHLYWWSWGDCTSDLTEKVLRVMDRLFEAGTVQNGFTRNFELFRRLWLGKHGPRLRIGYHTETPEEAVRLSQDAFPSVTCCPDVEIGKGVIYKTGRVEAKCCGTWCEWMHPNGSSEFRMADCHECFLNRRGCFA